MNLLERAFWVADTVREHASVQRSLKIAPTELVLDVGSGGSPNLRSNVLCDKFVEDAVERGGSPLPGDRPLVIGDVASLPFASKSFDFVICSHVLEHVEDPAVAVQELQRVGRRGYIETPSAEFERVVGFPFHRWMVSVREGRLVFQRKRAARDDPELAAWFSKLQRELRISKYVWFQRRRVGVFSSLHWEGHIPVEIHDVEKETDDFVAAHLGAELGNGAPELDAARAGAVGRMINTYGRWVRRQSDRDWPDIEPLLQCPRCGGTMRRSGAAELACEECDARYPIDSAGRPWLLV